MNSSGIKVDLFSSHPEIVALQRPLDSVFAVEEATVQGTDPKGIGV
jgi:hypothetical protein